MTAPHRLEPAPNPDAPPGTCRWCLRPTGDQRRRWHPGCLAAWKVTQPGPVQYRAVARRDGNRCWDCGFDPTPRLERVDRPWQLDVDHDWPLDDGGPNTLENMRLRCHRCHRAKTVREQRARIAARILGEALERGEPWTPS